MGDVLLKVVPIALAIAVSPFAIIPAILLLFTARPRAAAGSFLGAWFASILLLAVALSAVATAAEQGATPTWASWLRIVGGVALVSVGLRKWATRGIEVPQPAWTSAISAASPRRAVRFGLLFGGANPKNIGLSAAAALAVGGHDLTSSDAAVILVVFAAVASLGVATPIVMVLVGSASVMPRLAAGKDWLFAHYSAVVGVVMVAIGVVLVLEGISELLS